ncbi:MAG TPA: hypothetical protein VK116_06685 [Planctomycetota bacterium]|nr:hypothetical protein [Planctomycetota bacterium]
MTDIPSPEEVEGLFPDLLETRKRMDEASAQANARLAQARDGLKKISLGISAWVPIGAPGLDVPDEAHFGYARLADDDAEFSTPRWDLYISEGPPLEPSADGIPLGYEAPKSALSCRRALRIAAARAIPRLIREIVKRAEEVLNKEKNND